MCHQIDRSVCWQVVSTRHRAVFSQSRIFDVLRSLTHFRPPHDFCNRVRRTPGIQTCGMRNGCDTCRRFKFNPRRLILQTHSEERNERSDRNRNRGDISFRFLFVHDDGCLPDIRGNQRPGTASGSNRSKPIRGGWRSPEKSQATEVDLRSLSANFFLRQPQPDRT